MHFLKGYNVKIKRSDGRETDAQIASMSSLELLYPSLVTVTFMEENVEKKKEVELGALCKLNPGLDRLLQECLSLLKQTDHETMVRRAAQAAVTSALKDYLPSALRTALSEVVPPVMRETLPDAMRTSVTAAVHAAVETAVQSAIQSLPPPEPIQDERTMTREQGSYNTSGLIEFFHLQYPANRRQ